MDRHTKVHRIGNSLGVILPKKILEELQVEEGQSLYISKRKDGGFTPKPRNEEFERQMEISRDLT